MKFVAALYKIVICTTLLVGPNFLQKVSTLAIIFSISPGGSGSLSSKIVTIGELKDKGKDFEEHDVVSAMIATSKHKNLFIYISSYILLANL